MSVKTERIANMLSREISDILMNEINDKDIRFVTITFCKVDTDLSLAQVYCTCLDESKKQYDDFIEEMGLNPQIAYEYSELLYRMGNTEDTISLLNKVISEFDYSREVGKCIQKLCYIYGIDFNKAAQIPYTHVRDHRTFFLEGAYLLCQSMGVEYREADAYDLVDRYEGEGCPHDPVYDCKRSIYSTWQMMKHLRCMNINLKM